MSTEIQACCEPTFDQRYGFLHAEDCENEEGFTREELILDLMACRRVEVPGTARWNELNTMIAGLKQ